MAPAPIARRRVWLIHALLLVMTAGSLFDQLTLREHWPFSPYPMYARARRSGTVTTLRLYGVVAGHERSGGGREIPMVRTEYIQPFDASRLTGALEQLWQEHQPAQYQRALADCLNRYEALRRAGRHHGPPLQGMRLYGVRWTVDPWARNVDRPDERKQQAELLRP